MDKKILFVGPYPPPISGQSFVFKTVYDIYPNSLLLDTKKFDNSLINFIYYFFYLLIVIREKRISKIYFTCSRSFLGSFKDIILLHFAKKIKVKIINHLHGSDFKELTSVIPKWYKIIFYYYYQNVDCSIVLTNKMRSEFQDFMNMKKVVIPNFYPKEFENLNIKKSNSICRILFFSNLMKSKGIFEFLNLSELLLNSNEKIEINIAGKLQKDKFMSLKVITKKFYKKFNKIKYKFKHRIKYHGFIQNEKKIDLYTKSDFFVLPSYFEAFPISVLEAMKSKNVIIISKTKYIDEIISNKNGLISNDLYEMYNYISNLAVNKERLKKIQNFNFSYSDSFSQKNFIDSISNIINLKF